MSVENAFAALRSGYLLLVVAAFLFFVAALVGLVGLLFAIPMGLRHGFGSAVGAAAVALAAVAVTLFGVFGRIRPGYRALAGVDKSFQVCYAGTTLMLVGLVLVALAFTAFLVYVVATQNFFTGAAAPLVGVAVVAFLLYLVGAVLSFIVGAFILYDRYKEAMFLVAGILYILDLALLLFIPGLLSTVANILMYMALGNVEKATVDKPSYTTKF